MIFALGDEDHLDNCFGWTRQRHTYTPKGIGAKVLQLCRYFAYVVHTQILTPEKLKHRFQLQVSRESLRAHSFQLQRNVHTYFRYTLSTCCSA